MNRMIELGVYKKYEEYDFQGTCKVERKYNSAGNIIYIFFYLYLLSLSTFLGHTFIGLCPFARMPVRCLISVVALPWSSCLYIFHTFIIKIHVVTEFCPL